MFISTIATQPDAPDRIPMMRLRPEQGLKET
jgi:hypothetical protein